MEKEYIKIPQGEIILYSISLSVEELIENTTVEYYDSETEEGYQRPLVPAHYRNIANYLRRSKNAFLPTAILTAVDPDQIKEGHSLRIRDKLRVVDGQHRIEGIKYLKEIDILAYNRISGYIFPSLVMVVPEDQKIHEINAFININKAGKPVSTDLAVELRDKIRKQRIELTKDNLIESVATRVTKEINKRQESIWYELIRAGDEPAKGKSISINAFHQSIFEIVHSYIHFKKVEIEDFRDVDELVQDLTIFLMEAWKRVSHHWKECFKNKKIENIKQYNIQKGIGVFSLHMVLNGFIESEKEDEIILDNFERVLRDSQVKYHDWSIGGIFSAYNSSTGFKKIYKYILNEEKLER